MKKNIIIVLLSLLIVFQGIYSYTLSQQNKCLNMMSWDLLVNNDFDLNNKCSYQYFEQKYSIQGDDVIEFVLLAALIDQSQELSWDDMKKYRNILKNSLTTETNHNIHLRTLNFLGDADIYREEIYKAIKRQSVHLDGLLYDFLYEEIWSSQEVDEFINIAFQDTEYINIEIYPGYTVRDSLEQLREINRAD